MDAELGIGGWELTPAERAFSLNPVVEIAAVLAAALEVAAIGGLGDLLAGGRATPGAVDLAGDRDVCRAVDGFIGGCRRAGARSTVRRGGAAGCRAGAASR